jgi:hypothetical protein
VIFGRQGSPKPTGAALEGWHENVEFIIDKDTLPSLVGAHTVLKAARIEANTAGAGGLAGGGDGGVQITDEVGVPDTGWKSYTRYVLYYGRLGTSPGTAGRLRSSHSVPSVEGSPLTRCDRIRPPGGPSPDRGHRNCRSRSFQ